MHLEPLTTRTMESRAGGSGPPSEFNVQMRKLRPRWPLSFGCYCSSFIFILMYLFLKTVINIVFWEDG